MRLDSKVIRAMSWLVLPTLLEAQTLEIINKKSGPKNAMVFFKITSDFYSDSGKIFSLKNDSRTIPVLFDSPLSSGVPKTIGVEVSSGNYNLVTDGQLETVKIHLGRDRADIGENIYISNGKLCCKDTIDVFLNEIKRKETTLNFSAPKEIASSADGIVIKQGDKVESFPVNSRLLENGNNSFSVNAPIRSGTSSLEILLKNEKGKLSQADVRISPSKISSYDGNSVNLKVTSNRETMEIRSFLYKPGRDSYLSFSKVNFIRNPEHLIKPKDFDNCFFEQMGESPITNLPPGEYIAEGELLTYGNPPKEFYRKKVLVIPKCSCPEYIEIYQKDYSALDGLCDFVFDEEDRVYDSWFKMFKEALLTEVYKEDFYPKSDNARYSRQLPIIINDKQYLLDLNFEKNDNSCFLNLTINGNKINVFDYTYNEIRSRGKTKKIDEKNSPVRVDIFSESKKVKYPPFLIEFFLLTHCAYKKERVSGYLREAPMYRTPSIYFSLRVNQFNEQTISLDDYIKRCH